MVKDTKDQWSDPGFAKRWDQSAEVGNPTRPEQLDMLVSLITHLYQPGTAILDLGIGSGQVEELLFARKPDAHVVGVDSSPVMLEMAMARLDPYVQQCAYVLHDLAAINVLPLPERTYQLVISVQALHHLTHEEQQAVFQFVARLLPENGVFLLVDRIRLAPEYFTGLYKPMWERLEKESKHKSGWSASDFLQRLQDKEDHPASLEELLSWLKNAGLHATCLHLHLNRAIIAGVKVA